MMDREIQKELDKIVKKEKRLIKERKKGRLLELKEKLEDKIPVGMEEKLRGAFYQGFKLVFEHGSYLVEKASPMEKLTANFQVQDYAYDLGQKKAAARRMRREAGRRRSANMGLTGLEGGLLGVLGVGLLDIPLFIGVMLKSVYEISLSYGFPYDTYEERIYILKIIEASLCYENREEQSAMTDRLGYALKKGSREELGELSLEEQMRKTADCLAADMLLLKFGQGAPVVGAVFGATNLVYLNKVTGYALLKYQKRYLIGKG